MLAFIFLFSDDVVNKKREHIKVNASVNGIQKGIDEHQKVLNWAQVLLKTYVLVICDRKLEVNCVKLVFQVGPKRLEVHLAHLRDSKHGDKIHYNILNLSLSRCKNDRYRLNRNVDEQLHKADRNRNGDSFKLVWVVCNEPYPVN